MKIYSLSKLLSLPFVVALAAMLYLEFVMYKEIGFWMLVPMVFLAILFVSHPYIDYWYLKKNPIPIDEKVLQWLETYVPFYNQLSAEDKEKYERRMSLYIFARQFTGVGSEQKEMPYDMKAMVASLPIQITFEEEDFLLGDFDRVFMYKHPFPSPRNQFLHTMETQIEDGVLIFSLEQFLPGLVKPREHYNIGMHAFVEAYFKNYPAKDYPESSDINWHQLFAVCPIPQETILKTAGFKSLDTVTVAGNYYFTFPEAFRDVLPGVATKFDQVFKNVV